MGRTSWRGAAVAAAFVLLGTACGGDDDGGDEAGATTAAVAATSTTGTTAAPTTQAATTTAAPATTAAAPSTTVAAEPPDVEELIARGNVNLAHGGGLLEAPELTLYAMATAIGNGADALELDLQLSEDGQLVVIHNPTVDATTNGTGPVSGYTADELRALDAAHWWVPDQADVPGLPESAYVFRGVRTGAVPPPPGFAAEDFGVPTLGDVVDRFPGRVLDVEIKEESGPAIVEAVATFIEERGIQDRIVVVSTSSALMDAFVQRLPGVAASPGLETLLAFKTSRTPMPGYRIAQVPPSYGDIVVTEEDLRALTDLGLVAWMFPADRALETAEFYGQLLDLGANGVIADRPSVLAGVVQDRS